MANGHCQSSRDSVLHIVVLSPNGPVRRWLHFGREAGVHGAPNSVYWNQNSMLTGSKFNIFLTIR